MVKKILKPRYMKIVSLSLAVSILAGAFPAAAAEHAQSSSGGSGADNEAAYSVTDGLKYYGDVLKTYDTVAQYDSKTVSLDVTAAKGPGKSFITENGKKLLEWTKSQDGYTFDFTCRKGLYTIELDYMPDPGSSADIVRSFKIDGKTPFAEAENVKLPCRWEASGPATLVDGDEEPSPLKCLQEITTSQVRDVYGKYSEPLIFSLGGGKHSLSVDYVTGGMELAAIRLVPYKRVISYSEYQSLHSAEKYTGKAITVQGEDAESATSRTLTPVAVKDPTMTPYTLGSERLNAVGGWVWRYGNDEITWKINAPQDGLYKIVLRVKQDYNGLTTYRQVRIDGKVPFSELLACPFYAADGFQTIQLGADTPYYFYFSKGKHTISLSAVTGELTGVIDELSSLASDISATTQDIRTITGLNPDPNFDYHLDQKIPELMNSLNDYRTRLEDVADSLKKICRGSTIPAASSILYEAEKIRDLVRNPQSIPLNLSELSEIQSTVSDYVTQFEYMPLEIDYISLQSPDEAVVQKKASLWESMQLTVVDFIQSFTKSAESSADKQKQAKELNVWVARGQDWGKLIQQMSSRDFTVKTGIKVNVNILPSGYAGIINGVSPLLLSIAAGNEPDIALGSDMDTPIELAIRGAAVDLSKFSGYGEVAKRFSPGTLEALTYNGGVYALPETMDFPLLLYRSDILSELNISVPDTWDEVWKYTLPKLKQINANFYLNSQPSTPANTGTMAMFSSLLFQNGGKFYNRDGTSALDSDAAYTAFSAYTKAFVQYQSSTSVNVYNEMRLGTVPMAIGYLSDYLMLDIAAPELYGRFEIAQIPGTKDKNGNILRYGSGSVTSAVMFSSSKKQQEGWKFLEWWTGDSVQESYASGIEAVVGPTGRWFSANLNAFFSLPWSKSRSTLIKNWLDKWYKNPANTLGGYMTVRSVNNAWTRTVMSGMNARDSLDQAYDEISVEIARKQQEYGVK